MSAWYMAMCVCGLMPVTPPNAHSPSAARIRPSTASARAAGSRPRCAGLPVMTLMPVEAGFGQPPAELLAPDSESDHDDIGFRHR
jgi:hypothetical protein